MLTLLAILILMGIVAVIATIMALWVLAYAVAGILILLFHATERIFK